MSRVTTFSRVFPSYHPRKGKKTDFVEKIWKSLYINGNCPDPLNDYIYQYAKQTIDLASYNLISPKHQTIRQGNRWKVGDKFSPRVWSGKPYYSKQITIAPDIEIKKVWDIEIKYSRVNGKKGSISCILINDKIWTDWDLLAKNDGLELSDLLAWFNKPMQGQIICWNEKINY